MQRAVIVLLVLLGAVGVTLLASGERPHSIYDEYDQRFQLCLAKAAQRVGKQTITVEPLSDRFRIPQKLTIRGTPREIGLTIGQVAKQTQARLPTVAGAGQQANAQLRELYQRIYPEYLDVIAGTAEVYGTPAERIDLRRFESDFTTQLWISLLKYERFYKATDFASHGALPFNHHCSAAAYFVDGHQFVGRNFDHASDRPHFFATLQMAGCYKVMGNTIYDITGEIDDGMNEKGLALCVASNDYGKYSLREPYPAEPAIVMWHMMQIVLQKCATVDEALALLRTVRVWFPEEGNHWLLADATGKSVVVEWAPGDRKPVVFDRPGPYELMTNTAMQEGEEYLEKNCRRYGRAKPLLEHGVRDSGDMLQVMQAMRITAGPGRSLWTSVMDLNARRFEVRYFKEFDRVYEFGF
jgi:predicted choloylglycine hydrolase